MMWETIQTQVQQGVATLSFNRPDSLNSFNRQMHEEMQQVLKNWNTDPDIRVIVIRGRGRAFSAGQDLKERAGQLGNIPLPPQGSLAKYYNPLINLIRQSPKPVIAAVNGVAAGAGANIALACDLVIAKESARFIQAFSKIGLIPDAGGTWMLPRLIGYARAMALTFLGEPVHAKEAAEMGMIWKMLPDTEFDAYIDDIAQRLAQQPTYALALTKQALQRSAENNMDQQLELEQNLQYLALSSQDYKEGVQAFVEKRPAQFTGC
jgi:2-(1,2-epoxy-1,2-dihydrophenyl)acetyl-CoA isomerase